MVSPLNPSIVLGRIVSVLAEMLEGRSGDGGDGDGALGGCDGGLDVDGDGALGGCDGALDNGDGDGALGNGDGDEGDGDVVDGDGDCVVDGDGCSGALDGGVNFDFDLSRCFINLSSRSSVSFPWLIKFCTSSSL